MALYNADHLNYTSEHMKKSSRKSAAFIFDSYEIDRASREIRLYYKLITRGEEISFCETYSFPKKLKWGNTSSVVFQNAVKLLHILAGISYWKTYCPKDIKFATYDPTKDEAAFFKKVYENGLGEFFYRNQIDFRRIIKFPADYKARVAKPAKVINKNRSLLLFGGGKDSLVSAELLKAAKKDFTFLYVATGAHANIMKDLLPGNAIVVNRKIDSKLFELNKEKSVLNGHVPISAIIAAVGQIAAILYGYRYVIASSERSSNYGNVKYLGKSINHQWSKSLEFDKLLANYTARYITPSIKYFSLLRPIYEIKILDIFSKFPKYFYRFSSCNRNFRINNNRLAEGVLWCGECPKCAFVFSMLSAFVSKDELIKIFGKNLYDDKNLIPLFEELLGIRKFKPFECVGTPEEMILAIFIAYKSGEYRGSPIMQMFSNKILTRNYNILKIQKEAAKVYNDHLIPREFASAIKLIKKWS